MPACPSWSTATRIIRWQPPRLAQWHRALRARGRGQSGRRLLRHRGAATSPRSTRCCGAWPRTAAGPGPSGANAVWVPSLASLYGQVASAPGKRLSLDRRALQRQRLAPLPPIAGTRRLGRLRRDGARAGEGRLARARSVHRLCRPRRGRRHERGGHPDARRGQRAAGDRFDRIAGARSRAEALWRQADHQFDQFRGRRGGRRTSALALAAASAPPSSRSPSTSRAWPRRSARKLAIAHRLYDFACGKHGLPPSDLLFDPLTFTICTGNDDDRRLGLETLDAHRAHRPGAAGMPDHPRPLQHLLRPQPAGAPAC